MNKKLSTIFAYLKELFPNPETELHYASPFQFVVAVMLSAQATDVQVNKVTKKLFEKIKYAEDLLTMGLAMFERAISSVNYYHTKAKHIWETASLLVKHDGNKKYKDGIPDTLEELMKLPGIGVKTGKLIAHVLYDKPFIAVDTHIHRVANRLGLVKSPIQKSSTLKDTPSFTKGGQKREQIYTISPEKTSEQLEKLIPDEYKDHAHHALVLFGRYYCTAKNPKCDGCKLKKICDYYRLKGWKVKRLKS